MELDYETPVSSSSKQQTYESLRMDQTQKKRAFPKVPIVFCVIGAVILLVISVTALAISLKTTQSNPESGSLHQSTPNNVESERLIQALKEQLNDLKVQLDDQKEQLHNLNRQIEHNEKCLNITMETVSTLEMLGGELSQINQNLSSRINSCHGEPVPATCPANYWLNRLSNTCYGLVGENKTWQGAKDYCEAQGHYLATFETPESASWFDNLRKTLPAWGECDVWLGGKRNADHIWKWYGRITVPFTFSIWSPGQPDNYDGIEDCLNHHYRIVDGQPEYIFSDYPGSAVRYFFCETNQIF